MQKSLKIWPILYFALSFKERLGNLPTNSDLKAMEFNTSTAKLRIEKWKNEFSANDSRILENKLKHFGITEKQFEFVLAETREKLSVRIKNSVNLINDLQRVLSNLINDAQNPKYTPKNLQDISYLLAEVFITDVNLFENIACCIDKNRIPIENPSDIFKNLLLSEVVDISWRVIILEIKIAQLENRLIGADSQQRFISFANYLQINKKRLEIFCRYPVLAKQLTLIAQQYLQKSLKFLTRLAKDWLDIKQTFFFGKDPGYLTHLIKVSDPHYGRQTGLIMEFSSGDKLIYKPRSISADYFFHKFLSWINEKGIKHQLKSARMLDKGDYGWIEYIEHDKCQTESEVERFYWRIGAHLSLFYLLGVTDQHFENIIAQKEQPIFIDLETMFQPRLTSEIDEFALYESVIAVGLLPQPSLVQNADCETNLSGLGFQDDIITPYKIAHWQNDGTDQVGFIRTHLKISDSQNQPSTEYKISNYIDFIINGFENIYQLLSTSKHEILEKFESSPDISTMKNRFLIRSTASYGQLLAETNHPYLLKNGLDKDRFLDKLWKLTEYKPELIPLIEAEHEDLSQGDVPIFITYPQSKDIITSKNQRIKGFFKQNGWKLMEKRLKNLNHDDLQRQKWLIETSFANKKREERAKIGGSVVIQLSNVDHNPINLAKELGDKLKNLAFTKENKVNWLGLSLFQEKGWFISPLGTDLYGGLPGIILFLAQLDCFCPNEGYNELARAALQTVFYKIERERSYTQNIGGFMGWGGIIYTLAYLGILWNEEELLGKSKKFALTMSNLIDNDQNIDFTSGITGFLLIILRLYMLTKNNDLLQMAIKCGEKLVHRAQKALIPTVWEINGPESQILTGFAHGAASLSWVLLMLNSITQRDSFKNTALAGIEYERKLFSKENDNWPDLRGGNLAQHVNKTDNSFMVAWCHGAPGIGIARLRCLDYLNDEKIEREIQIALKTTLSQGFGNNHSLCHGDLGNLELFFEARKLSKKWYQKWQDLGKNIVIDIKHNGWRCGIPFDCESLGLMTGISGIGYGLLRLAKPNRVPSILTLDLPRAA